MEGPVFRENINDGFSIEASVTEVYHTHRSIFQSIHILNTSEWGRCLVLDRHMQSTEKDEFIYHEMLVHPALLFHPNPKTVYVAGGGEGATIREVLKHKSVQKVVMVDIDGECVDVCKKYLKTHHKGSFDDKRLKLVIDDAKSYLEKTDEKFDIYIGDLTDPVEDSPTKLLYTKSYFNMVKSKLNPNGIVVTQSGPCGILTHGQVFTAINKTLASVFPRVLGGGSFIPSFVDCWGVNIASTNPDYDLTNYPPAEVNKRIQERLKNPEDLKYYDGLTHQSIFILPKLVREGLKNETRIITEEEPLVIP